MKRYLNKLAHLVHLAAKLEKASKGLTLFDIALRSQKYKNLLKTQTEIYKSNILEKEAFAAQNKYTASVIKWRPTTVNDALMADALVKKYLPLFDGLSEDTQKKIRNITTILLFLAPFVALKLKRI